MRDPRTARRAQGAAPPAAPPASDQDLLELLHPREPRPLRLIAVPPGRSFRLTGVPMPRVENAPIRAALRAVAPATEPR